MTYQGPPHGPFPSMSNSYPSYMEPGQRQYHQQPPMRVPAPMPTPLHIPQQPQYPQYNMTSNSNHTPASPSQQSDDSEEKYKNVPLPPSISRIHEGKAYVLEIAQQPQRARMCGFGDKDRRPISPPPCIRLRILDATTHKDIDYSKVEILSRFVLIVDLADATTNEEKNLVKHSSQSPSISTVTTTGYTPTAAASSPAQNLPNYNMANGSGYASQPYAAQPSRPADRQYSVNGTGSQQHYYTNGNGLQQYRQNSHGPYAQRYNPQFPNPYGPPSAGHMGPPESRGSVDIRSPPGGSGGTCTRNLIGSLSGSAFKLHDLKDEVGLWFVFQDLSVRTEGWFRLKFSLFDIMADLMVDFVPTETSTASLAQHAPMLACTYSESFHVYSAKKFPGVIESTELSKEFAKQGIKIPIRKDGGAKDPSKPGDKRKRPGQAHGSGESDDEPSPD